jgi:hypothetical protein
LPFYIQDLKTPGLPFVAITEAQFRSYVSQYIRDVDGMENGMAADTHWLHFPDRRLWISTPGTFNPATTTFNPSANLKATHRRGDNVY